MYYIGTPKTAPDTDNLSSFEMGKQPPETLPEFPERDRLLASYEYFGIRRLVACQTLDDVTRLLELGGNNQVANLSWFTGLPLPTSSLDDPSIEKVPVVGREMVRRGDRVKHWAQRWTGCATATVIGFYNEDNTSRPWMRVIVIGDSPKEYYSSLGLQRGWDYDRTEVAPNIVVP